MSAGPPTATLVSCEGGVLRSGLPSSRVVRGAAVEGPVLITKLFVPRPRATTVDRPRLSEKLQEGAQTKLTVLSAPAGSTTV